ncbi:hypothetical protein CEXT_739871 [Caerostris extrusa]|uniref:Uncharacterized protein n=1 Tax=Caerostris extrusa TaxID=172846 RepID=A0AAV4T618_CAEEX|nr:hypothetical protein CEXT_739871 [Caerostris extrusa]
MDSNPQSNDCIGLWRILNVFTASNRSRAMLDISAACWLPFRMGKTADHHVSIADGFYLVHVVVTNDGIKYPVYSEHKTNSMLQVNEFLTRLPPTTSHDFVFSSWMGTCKEVSSPVFRKHSGHGSKFKHKARDSSLCVYYGTQAKYRWHLAFQIEAPQFSSFPACPAPGLSLEGSSITLRPILSPCAFQKLLGVSLSSPFKRSKKCQLALFKTKLHLLYCAPGSKIAGGTLVGLVTRVGLSHRLSSTTLHFGGPKQIIDSWKIP